MLSFGGSSLRCVHGSVAELIFWRSFSNKCNLRSKILSPSVGNISLKKSFHINCRLENLFDLTTFDSDSKMKQYKTPSLPFLLNINKSNKFHRSVQTHHPVGHVPDLQLNPYSLVVEQLEDFYKDLREILQQGTTQPELQEIATYYFDGKGKALRPMVTMLMSKAINFHLKNESSQILSKQRQIAIFSEMIHAAGLLQDDVIDEADFRRGKPSANMIWNHKKVLITGHYVFAAACITASRLENHEVTIILSKILIDVVVGELMQLDVKESEDLRFSHYLSKTYHKTASLVAHTLKSTAVIAGVDNQIAEIAFQYGRHLGLAHQLTDDMLDFVSSSETLGKSTATDLKQGLATAPVLFACEKYPELNSMIVRRFKEPGDVERAFELVHKSEGLEQTRILAKKHCTEALRLTQELIESPYQRGLEAVSNYYLNRVK